MNLIKKTTLALGLLAAASASYAQTTPTSNGVLGQSYLEFNYNFADLDSVDDNGHAGTVSLNLPVIPSLLDVGGSYTYSWIGGAARAHANTFTGYANAYTVLDGAKPFVGAGVGYTWASLPFGLGDHDPFWSLTAGVEIPVGAFTVTPKITYSDDFSGRIGNSDDSWEYAVEGNYWFSPKAGAFASVAKIDYHRDPLDVWSYKVGVRLKF
jgi:hypothetical protein